MNSEKPMRIRIEFGEYWNLIKKYVSTFDLSTMNGRFPRGITQYTHENPLTVIGFTLFVGIVMGAFSFLAAQISVRRHMPKKTIKKEPTIEEEEEELDQQDFNVPPPLRGGFDTKMLANIRRSKGLARKDEDDLFETKFKCSIENMETEVLLNEEPEKKDQLKPEKKKNEEKKGKKSGFNKTRINTKEEKNLGDLSSLANENILGTLGELHGKLKTAEIRAKSRLIEKEMSQDQIDEEARIKAQQMEAIFKLMMADEEKFGIHDKNEMEEQFKLYSL